VPAMRLVWRIPQPTDFEKLKQQIAERVRSIEGFEQENEERRRGYVCELTATGALIWAEGEIVSEPPRKIEHASRETSRVSTRLEQEYQRTEKELLVEVAYVVPTEEFQRQINELRRRGVSVKIMTSALEATDVSLVFAAYEKYRPNLLEAGVELYEYKAHAGLTRSERKWYKPRSLLSSLHTKAIVFDRERVYIGSANLDPRSVKLNTEIAVLVHSKRLARQMADYLAEDFSPARSWRVQLHSAWEYRPERNVWRERKYLTWVGEHQGKPTTLYFEHAASLWQRTKAFLYSLLPGIEPQL